MVGNSICMRENVDKLGRKDKVGDLFSQVLDPDSAIKQMMSMVVCAV